MGRKGEGLKVIKKPAEEQLAEFTPAELATARHMAGLYTYSKAVQAVVIAWFCGEEKYYRSVGYSTEQEFMEMFAGKSYKQGRKYKEVGKAFLKLNPIDLPEEITDDSKVVVTTTLSQEQPVAGHLSPLINLTKTENLQKMGEFIEKIGIEKFYELTQYKLDYQELIDGGVVVMQNGEKLSVEDVINNSTRELLSKIQNLEEELSHTKNDLTKTKSVTEEQVKFANSELDRLKGIESKFGAKASMHAEKQNKLRDGLSDMRSAFGNLINANVMEDDGQDMIKDMSEAIREWDEKLGKLRGEYSFITLALEE